MGACGSNTNAVENDDGKNTAGTREEKQSGSSRSGGASSASRGDPFRTTTGKQVRKDYVFTKTLGKGGSCRVVEGYVREQKEDVMAIKILARQQKVNEMLFKHEVNILKRIKHKNIIEYLDSFQDEESYYVLTTLCQGGELFDRIVQKDFHFTERMVSRLVGTMLEALKCCHDQHIVHRDLKPENFVFKDKTADSEMVLIDFGCAKVVEDDKEYKDLVGTPYYLAPESARAITRRFGRTLKSSDIWSVGVIAYVMMTGRPPFNGKSNPDIFKAILTKQLKFPRDVELSPNFKDFVEQVLQKEWKKRPTVEQCLDHKWVRGEGTSNKEMNQEVLRCLVQFNNQSKLKKAITKCLSKNMGEQPRKKIQDHFNRLDKNGDGGLDAEELTFLLTDLGYSIQAAPGEAKRIISEVDGDGDGEIQFEEFAQVWQRKLLTVNDKYAQAVFKVLDHDGDGFISADELKSVLQMDDTDVINAMIDEVDTDKDGKISFEEFKAAMKEGGDGAFGMDAQGYGNNPINIKNVDDANLGGLGLDNDDD